MVTSRVRPVPGRGDGSRSFIRSLGPDSSKPIRDANAMERAAREVLAAYLRGAVFAQRSRLASLFKRLLTAAQLDGALAALAGKVIVMPAPRGPIYIWNEEKSL